MINFTKFLCTAFICFIVAGGLNAQPFLGTNTFATASTVVLAASAPCTSDRTLTYLGFQFTLRSGVNCAMNNATGASSDGHINFITTPDYNRHLAGSAHWLIRR